MKTATQLKTILSNAREDAVESVETQIKRISKDNGLVYLTNPIVLKSDDLSSTTIFAVFISREQIYLQIQSDEDFIDEIENQLNLVTMIELLKQLEQL